MTTVTQRGATITAAGPNGVFKVRRHRTKRGQWQIVHLVNNRARLVMNWSWGRDTAMLRAYGLASDH